MTPGTQGGDLPAVFGGMGLETSPESSAGCIALCEERQGCHYWTWVMGARVNCYLKSGRGVAVRRAKHVSGSVPGACTRTPPSPTCTRNTVALPLISFTTYTINVRETRVTTSAERSHCVTDWSSLSSLRSMMALLRHQYPAVTSLCGRRDTFLPLTASRVWPDWRPTRSAGLPVMTELSTQGAWPDSVNPNPYRPRTTSTLRCPAPARRFLRLAAPASRAKLWSAYSILNLA